MTPHFGVLITLVIALGIGAQWLAWRLKIPAIILLLLTGLLAGPVFFNALDPGTAFGPLLQPVIGLAVAMILFEGGLNLPLHELKTAATGVRRLLYFGVPLSWLFGSVAAYYVGGLSWPVALVFGAIVVVTGPTVILPLLRGAMLNRRTASYLKWEGIVNDPIGALLAVLVFQYFLYRGADAAISQVLADLGLAVLTAGGLGAVFALGAGFAYRRDWVPEYLKVPMTIVLVLGAYTITNTVQHDAGLLAVTVMGITMGNLNLPSIEDMRRFKEYITIILVSCVFVLLTADIEPTLLLRLDWCAAMLIAAVVLVVRPLMVYLATLGAGMDWRDRLVLAWIAPRGIVAAAVSGVFGSAMVNAGYADAQLLTPLVFMLIFVTVILHGSTLGVLARWLGLASHKRNRVLVVGASPWSTALVGMLQDVGLNVLLVDGSWHRLRAARLAGLPVYYGEILSEAADESLELADIGTLLAVTSNDAYNALVCNAFSAELGRTRIFQLPMYAADDDDPRGVARTTRGIVAFGEQAMYEELWRWLAEGWTFQKTRLTESYDYEDYRRDFADDSLLLFVVRPNEELVVHSPQFPLQPRVGDTVISFSRQKAASLQQTLRSPAPQN